VEAGELEIVDYPELLAWDRFRASQDGLTFWPTAHLGGTDLLKVNPDIKEFPCPLTGRRLWALPPAAPDVVVLHVLMADPYGNCTFPARRLLPQSLDIQLSRSCDTVIVTAEKIVSTEAIKRRPHLTEIPAFRVSAVVEAPWGAHPCPVLGFSRADDEHFSEYVSASHSEAGFEDYLSRYVTGVPDHVAYLERVGTSRLLHLLTSDPAA
jgi:glutaconate CoA-transferase subunit A